MTQQASPTVRYFVQAMRNRRAKLGMTQQDVADRAGLSLATVNQIEGMKRLEADLASLEKIAAALNDSFENLIWTGKLMSSDETLEFRKVVGSNIAALRADRDWTRHMLAMKIGMAPSHLINIEAGKSSASLDKLFLIARALGVRVVDLVKQSE